MEYGIFLQCEPTKSALTTPWFVLTKYKNLLLPRAPFFLVLLLLLISQPASDFQGAPGFCYWATYSYFSFLFTTIILPPNYVIICSIIIIIPCNLLCYCLYIVHCQLCGQLTQFQSSSLNISSNLSWSGHIAKLCSSLNKGNLLPRKYSDKTPPSGNPSFSIYAFS